MPSLAPCMYPEAFLFHLSVSFVDVTQHVDSFAQDRRAVIVGSNLLRNAAGNFYINECATSPCMSWSF